LGAIGTVLDTHSDPFTQMRTLGGIVSISRVEVAFAIHPSFYSV